MQFNSLPKMKRKNIVLQSAMWLKGSIWWWRWSKWRSLTLSHHPLNHHEHRFHHGNISFIMNIIIIITSIIIEWCRWSEWLNLTLSQVGGKYYVTENQILFRSYPHGDTFICNFTPPPLKKKKRKKERRKQAHKPRSYSSLKLLPTDRLTYWQG